MGDTVRDRDKDRDLGPVHNHAHGDKSPGRYAIAGATDRGRLSRASASSGTGQFAGPAALPQDVAQSGARGAVEPDQHPPAADRLGSHRRRIGRSLPDCVCHLSVDRHLDSGGFDARNHWHHECQPRCHHHVAQSWLRCGRSHAGHQHHGRYRLVRRQQRLTDRYRDHCNDVLDRNQHHE